MLFMTRYTKLLFLLILVIAAFAANSCKKDNVQTSLTTFLTERPWKLALLQRLAYVNSSLVKTDTLRGSCALTQTLIFSPANTYTYQNYACATGTINASWSFTVDNQYLNLNSVISVNSAGKQNVARITNLGQYSLAFDAGDVNVTPISVTDSVIVFRYGFIH